MRILNWILGGLVVLVVAFVAIGMVLPRQVTVTRSTDIAAPPSEIFPYVNSMKATEAWSPWLAIDPDNKLTYSGPASGVGNKLAWASDHPQVGNGTQEIIASEPDRRVETALDFGDMGTATAEFLLVEAGGNTTVTWGLTADMGAGPVGRWMGLMMDSWVGPDYEKGLENLKAVVEG